ncbi:MAG: adenylate/guanylate cyclase domain-containing protein [Terrimicrobiaceae bacterium]|nr:adenylate/guanylate cyclase domain-containing protein [Terrimicrobiaceae bacterium]
MILLLLAATQAATFLLVAAASRRAARERIAVELSEASRTFERIVERRIRELGRAVELLSSDYAFASTFTQLRESNSAVARATLESALENYRGRIGSASFLRLVSLDYKLLAGTERSASAGAGVSDRAVFAAAEDSPDFEATAVEARDGRAHLVVVRPLLTPDPAAWIVVGFPLDDALAGEFRELSDFETTFIDKGRMVASTFHDALRRDLAGGIARGGERAGAGLREVRLGSAPYLGSVLAFPGDPDHRAAIVVLRSLDTELAPFRKLENVLLALSAIALGGSAVVGFFVARGVARPAVRLAEGVQKIERGDYRARVPVETHDELGRLAGAFNQMAAGLQERDKVRDILGKVVSPEIARELMNSEVALGGEVLEASVLFTDLRGFTAFSETQSPQALVSQLNVYFTAITEAVEAHGGIVDKYVGDAVMAVFGAPVRVPDHADRAVEAALAILHAEERLNGDRASEGLPPFRTGIGISAGVLVAGNIGSATRHNYTVIGNEVNLASRLEGLTKSPEFRARIICSDAVREAFQRPHSLRDLGETEIRGKARSLRIWAVE